MSNYEHSDWYCKPANESEAREIIERAVASGARNADRWTGANWATASYGVYLGRVDYRFSRSELAEFVQYTIEQVRELFPLPVEQQTKWNVEGVLLVGTIRTTDGQEVEIAASPEYISRYVRRLENIEQHGAVKIPDTISTPEEFYQWILQTSKANR